MWILHQGHGFEGEGENPQAAMQNARPEVHRSFYADAYSYHIDELTLGESDPVLFLNF